MKEKQTEIKEATESILEALNDAFACFDDDNDIEGAVSDLNTMQKYLRILLPKTGIYAWIHEDFDRRFAMVFSSVEEAEKELKADIDDTLEDHDCDEGDYSDLTFDKYNITLNIEFDNVYWKRMYNPSPETEKEVWNRG